MDLEQDYLENEYDDNALSLDVEPEPFEPYLGILKSILVLVLLQGVTFVIGIIMSVLAIINSNIEFSKIDAKAFEQQLNTNGYFLAESTFYNAILSLALLYIIIQYRRGVDFKTYIGFNKVSLKVIFETIMIILALKVVMVLPVSSQLTHLKVDDFMLIFVQSDGPKLFFWFTIVVAAPVFEEILFRGFFLESLIHSKLSVHWSIGLSSLIWTLLHTQYGLQINFFLFFIGLFFGYYKIRYNSIWPPIAGHVSMNLTSFAIVSAIHYFNG